MTAYEELAKILSVNPDFLERIDHEVGARTGRTGVMARVAGENRAAINRTLAAVGLSGEPSAEEVRKALREASLKHDRELTTYLETMPGADQFEKAANLARQTAGLGKGFFLKREFGQEILRKSVPDNLLKFLGYSSVEELLGKHDVTEIFSALRFIETDEWMHGTFEKAYSDFTAAEFEEREIEIKVLGPEWHEVAKKFVAKKHHNVSHLKEFGVIFLNPISEDTPGKFLRDFALLFHYFHEIDFYSKLFRHYSEKEDFPAHLKALLRGDVPSVVNVKEAEWLIVQRYLFKDNPKDLRLFLPRVNPESVHWLRGERDLANLGAARNELGLELWRDLDWVGARFYHDDGEVVSFDLEDNAMTAVSFSEGKADHLNYHQREALWTRLFMEYAGGEQAMEDLLMKSYDKGSVVFGE